MLLAYHRHDNFEHMLDVLEMRSVIPVNVKITAILESAQTHAFPKQRTLCAKSEKIGPLNNRMDRSLITYLINCNRVSENDSENFLH